MKKLILLTLLTTTLLLPTTAHAESTITNNSGAMIVNGESGQTVRFDADEIQKYIDAKGIETYDSNKTDGYSVGDLVSNGTLYVCIKDAAKGVALSNTTYFKTFSTWYSEMQTLSSTVSSLSTQVSSLNTTVSKKADASTVTSLSNTVSTLNSNLSNKADKSALSSYSTIANTVSNIYVGGDGYLHMVKGGADTALPFNNRKVYISTISGNGSYNVGFTPRGFLFMSNTGATDNYRRYVFYDSGLGVSTTGYFDKSTKNNSYVSTGSAIGISGTYIVINYSWDSVTGTNVLVAWN